MNFYWNQVVIIKVGWVDPVWLINDPSPESWHGTWADPGPQVINICASERGDHRCRLTLELSCEQPTLIILFVQPRKYWPTWNPKHQNACSRIPFYLFFCKKVSRISVSGNVSGDQWLILVWFPCQRWRLFVKALRSGLEYLASLHR